MAKNFLNYMLYNRQKCLLSIINQLNENGIASRTYLMKTLFLLKQEFPDFGYDFYPYSFGPFSQTAFWDLDYLKTQNLISSDEREITKNGKEKMNADDQILAQVINFTKQFANNSEIISFVYAKYPEYTEKSKLVEHKNIKQAGKFTIGYEGKSIDYFMNQLIQNKITKLIDVRKNAYSMKRGFSKGTLQKMVENAGIQYEHIPKLGIESDKRQKLDTKEDYEKLFKEYRVSLLTRANELNYVSDAGCKEKIAIMCFEKDPKYCHRGQISDYIGGFGHL